MESPQQRKSDSQVKSVDKNETEGLDDSSRTSSVLLTLLFTAWIFLVVEKCISGNWDILTIPLFPPNINNFIDLESILTVFGWFSLQCLLYILPVGGKLVDGLPVGDNGVRLKYRLNAFFVLTLNILGFFACTLSGMEISSMSDTLLQMTTAGVIMIFLLSIVLYIKGLKKRKSGILINNWFNGSELNPRWGLFDLKYVCFRSGIIGWILMNFINITKSFETDGPTSVLLLVSGLQLLYVADYFWFEEGLLVTRDIVHERFGYNLLIQFLMIPFCFSVQTRYLMKTQYTPPWYKLLAVSMLNLVGYCIYRGSNSEKNNFRKNPGDQSFSGYEVIQTSTGKNLLVSGWWGICRHPNYLGDILISFSYALATGFNHFLPYLNPLILFIMLVDREKKDGAECAKRYGEAWEKYCHRVKYRIFPYVY